MRIRLSCHGCGFWILVVMVRVRVEYDRFVVLSISFGAGWIYVVIFFLLRECGGGGVDEV